MTRHIEYKKLQLQYLDELSAEMDRVRLKPRLELLERFYQLSTQTGFTHQESVEYDAIKIVLKAIDFESDKETES